VDDNEDARMLLADILGALGHDVRDAGDGPAALQVVPGFTPEVAILDIGLPGMDGFELARHLRAALPGAAMRLIAVSGYGQPADFARSAAAGFDRHLVKPVELRRLVDTITELTP
jgi:CheY-like chemotaxis protein